MYFLAKITPFHRRDYFGKNDKILKYWKELLKKTMGNNLKNFVDFSVMYLLSKPTFFSLYRQGMGV